MLTAVMCVNYLTSILARLTCRQLPVSHCYEVDRLRVLANVPTLEGQLAEAFDQIRGNVAIIVHLLGATDILASFTMNPQGLNGG